MFSIYRKLDSKFLTRFDKANEKELTDYCLRSISSYKKKSKDYRQKVKSLSSKYFIARVPALL